MSSLPVSTGVFSSFLTQDAFRFDQNRDGKLNRQEIATAALNFKDSDPKLFSLLSTFVVGGANGQGLLPDMDGDGMLSQTEAQRFAFADIGMATSFPDLLNRANTITTDDFKAFFGNQVMIGGQAIDENQLRQIAGQGQPTSGGSNDGALLALVTTLLTLLVSWIRPSR